LPDHPRRLLALITQLELTAHLVRDELDRGGPQESATEAEGRIGRCLGHMTAMTSSAGQPVIRYRIAPWPTRILIPIMALVLIAGIIHDGDPAPAVLIPVVVVAAVGYLMAAERIGLYCSASGLESRMTRRVNSFRFEWREIDRFAVVNNGAQVAIVAHLTDGGRRLLPSTRAWRYQRSLIVRMCADLNRRAAAPVAD
jgi:hypothetical protein